MKPLKNRGKQNNKQYNHGILLGPVRIHIYISIIDAINIGIKIMSQLMWEEGNTGVV